MDFSPKQWRNQEKQQEHESEVEQNQTHPPAKIPKLFLTHPLVSHSDINSLPPLPSSTTEATDSLVGLSLFPDDSISPTFHSSRMMMGGGGGGNWYFSMSQLQELELQALIYKYFLAGSSVPPQLLNPIKRSILLQSHPYFIQQHFSPYHSSPLLQTGYWGKGAMDPEPGRCRRTDGKKWRCSRDVVPGHKYCERHVHRGRNRSRKPVESPTTTTASPTLIGAGRDGATTTTAGSGGGSAFNSNTVTIAAAAAPAVASVNRFSLSGQSPSTDFLQLNPSSSTDTSRGLCGLQSGVVENRCGGRVLRPFFDDWPRSSLQEGGNCDAGTNEATDVSLKLSTGDAEDYGQRVNDRVDLQSTQQFNWGSGWATTHVTSMGGPLAEALRSSTTTSNCSPTSVLHQLQPPRGSVSEISYVST